jgi:hypothetical protein
MHHLSQHVLLALAEQSHVDAESARHATECVRCRDEVLSLARVLREVRAVDVPEPSPLFWDYLSARVRARIDSEARPRLDFAHGTFGWRWWPALASGLAAIGLLVMSLGPARQSGMAPVAPPRPGRPLVAVSGGPVTAWQTVLNAAAAAEPAIESVDVAVTPTSAERALLDLSPEEDVELARLLRQEMRRPAL